MSEHCNEDRTSLLLRDADPVTVPDAPTPESEALLARILAEPRLLADRQRDRRRPRRLLVGAALAVAVLVAVALPAARLLGLPLLDAEQAQAATPPLLTTSSAPTLDGAAEQLRRIATQVQDLPDDVGTGSGVEVDYRSWSLFTRVDGVDVTSRVVPETTTLTVGGTGDGTLTRTITDDDGDERTTVTEVSDQPVAPLPDDPAGMRAELARTNPNGAAGRFNAVVETLLDRPAGPGARAVILRYLASTEGVSTVGRVEDRLGRDGVGFTVTSAASGLPTRYLMVVDPRDGRILGYEEMLTEDPGRLEVAIPSVIAYVAWKSARRVG